MLFVSSTALLRRVYPAHHRGGDHHNPHDLRLPLQVQVQQDLGKWTTPAAAAITAGPA